MDLNKSIECLNGVGPKTLKNFNEAGINTLMDLVLYFPRDYENIDEFENLDFQSDKKYVIRAEFVSASLPVRTRTGKKLVTLNFISTHGKIKATYFNMPYIGKSFKTGEFYNLYGKFSKMGNTLSITSPKVIKDEEAGFKKDDESGEDNYNKGKVIAKYPLHQSITEGTLKKLINQVLSTITIRENLSKKILDEFNFPSLDEAIKTVHNPEKGDFKKSMERLKFQELFSYSMKMAAAKELRLSNKSGIMFKMSGRLSQLKDSIPYSLTEAQNRSIREILIDQKKDIPMNRLLQGDVGSGKTIVALIALFNVVENGYQAVFMAPTEILATQHYEEAKKLLEPFNIEILLLTGSTKSKERNEIKEKLENNIPCLIIGTHALLEDDITIGNLGMVVTDEQHRFGVNQRAKLIGKNKNADVLVMSATPIPRTLAMHMYSDLDLSVIDELPPGRRQVKTLSFTRNRQKEAYKIADEEIKSGRQVYIVTPLIEENDTLNLTSVEKLYEYIKTGPFKDYIVDMLHGRMKAKEKKEIMEAFKKGDIDVLISTTVIEVGVNVPNASVMIIENAERFGLSQLHQLRGRVGRGEYQSYCIMITDSSSEDTRQRMKVMTSTNDGFIIAQEDLKMRGTGAILGTNQSGASDLTLSDFILDYQLFISADKWANIVFKSNEKDFIRIKNEILGKMDKTLDIICLN